MLLRQLDSTPNLCQLLGETKLGLQSQNELTHTHTPSLPSSLSLSTSRLAGFLLMEYKQYHHYNAKHKVAACYTC